MPDLGSYCSCGHLNYLHREDAGAAWRGERIGQCLADVPLVDRGSSDRTLKQPCPCTAKREEAKKKR